MKHLKTIKLFENFDMDDIFTDIKNLQREDYYFRIDNNQVITLKEITDRLEIRKKIEKIFTGIDLSYFMDKYHVSFSLMFGRNKLTFNIKEVEDEWFYVDVFFNSHNVFDCFKCDQQEGLFAFLLDLKKVLDKRI